MEKNKGKLFKLLIAFLFVPMMVFFSACGNDKSSSSSSNTNKDQSYVVHFYTGTDESFNIPNQTIPYGGLVRKPQTPTKQGYIFVGWYIDMNFTTAWTFEVDIVKQNLTLYARWEEKYYG